MKNHRVARASPPCITRSLFHTVYVQPPLPAQPTHPADQPHTATFTYCHNKNQPHNRGPLNTRPNRPKGEQATPPNGKSELKHTTLPARTFTPTYQQKAPDPPRFMHSSHHTAPIDAGTIENPVTKTPRQDHPKGTHNTGRQAYRGRPQSQREQKTHTTARQTEPASPLILAPHPHCDTLHPHWGLRSHPAHAYTETIDKGSADRARAEQTNTKPSTTGEREPCSAPTATKGTTRCWPPPRYSKRSRARV